MRLEGREVIVKKSADKTAPSKPSLLPVITGAVACLLGLVIVSISSLKTGSPLIYLAYLCVPFAPIGGLALARATDIKGRSNNRFDIAKSDKVLKFCSILAIVGFLIAIPVMVEIANRFSQV
jgi:hypothetical protein